MMEVFMSDDRRREFEYLDNVGDGIIIADSGMKVVHINRMGRLLLGMHTEDVVGMPLDKVFRLESSQDSSVLNIDFEKTYVQGESLGLSRDTLLVDMAGNRSFISATISRVDPKEGQEASLFITFRNIDRIRKVELGLERLSLAVKESPNLVCFMDDAFKIEYMNLGAVSPQTPTMKELLEQQGIMVDVDMIRNALRTEDKWKSEMASAEGKTLLINIFRVKGQNIGQGQYVMIMEDVSRLRSAEKKAMRESVNLEVIFSSIPVGLLICDERGQVKRINQAAAEIFEADAINLRETRIGDELNCLNKHVGGYECGEGDQCKLCFLNRAIHDVIQKGKALQNEEHEFKYIGKDSTVKRKIIKTNSVRIAIEDADYAVVILEDVSKSKSMERDLLSKERRLRLITDNMSDIITQVDANGTITYASPSAMTMLGYNPDKLIGRNLMEFIYDEDIPRAKELFSKRISSMGNYISEVRLKKFDSSYMWVESSANVIVEESKPASIVYVSRDITMNKKAKFELQRSKEIAEAANNAKSQFLANMSHEIRTPMNGIIGMTNVTLMSNLTDEQRENLTLVRNSAVNLLNLINSILDFSKIEAGKMLVDPVDFDVRDLIDKTVKPFEVQAVEKELKLDIALDPKLPKHVKADINKIRQILMNLIGNAMKFTDQGNVTVSVFVKDRNEFQQKCTLLLAVEDTGIGIHEKDMPKIFSSFSQGDGTMTRKYGGTGLGLAISKQLVELMGGEIRAFSERGKGSRFEFELTVPFDEEERAMDGHMDELSIPDDEQKLEILLVEDDLVNQKLALRLLGRQGHHVVVANNGVEAVDWAAQKSFDVILMDIQMPKMDGMEATSLIRNKLGLRDVPIIAVTAHALKGDEEKFREIGMNDYISKPITVNGFFETIKRNVRQRPHHTSVDDLIQRISNNMAKESDVTSEVKDEGMVAILRKMEEIEEAKNFTHYDEIERIASEIKPVANRCGLEEVRKQALMLEIACRKEDIQKVTVEIDKLKNLLPK